MKNIHKTLLFFFILALFSKFSAAQFPQLRWAHGFGATGEERGNSVLTGKNGEIYATGYFKWAVDFDPGPGNSYLYGLTNDEQAYVIKFDTAGQHIWAKAVSGAGANFGIAVAYDSGDNVYLAGNFYAIDSTDFDPGPGEHYLQSQKYDFFILKMDAAGNFIWAKIFGGSENDYVTGMKIDDQDNLILCGTFESMADFDPGPGTSSLIASFVDGFVLKIDSAGQFVWVRQLGNSNSNEACNALALGSGGMIYLTGYHASSTDFDPGPGTFYLPFTGSSNLYIWKLNSSGLFQQAITIGGSNNDGGLAIAVDAMENIIIGGSFFDSVDFDPGPGVAVSTSNDHKDLFVSKYDSSFNYLWSYSAGSTDVDIIKSLVIDSAGNILATGSFRYTVDFDPGPATWLLTAVGIAKILTIKISSTGTFIWAVQSSSAGGTCEGRGIDIDTDGNMYITGSYRNLCDFDPGTGVYYLNAAGYSDIALFSYKECPGVSFAISASGNTNICLGQTVTLLADTTYASWQWYRNQSAIIGATNSSFTTSMPGNYHCVTNDFVGCISYSNTVIVRIICRPANPPEERISHHEFYIYPNPGKGQFIVVANTGIFSVIDVNGKVVFKQPIQEAETLLDLSILQSGIYMVIHQSNESRATTRLIITD